MPNFIKWKDQQGTEHFQIKRSLKVAKRNFGKSKIWGNIGL